MANHKKPEDEKVHPVGGCVLKEVKGKLLAKANREGVTVSKVVAEILTDWAVGLPSEVGGDENQLTFEELEEVRTKLKQDEMDSFVGGSYTGR